MKRSKTSKQWMKEHVNDVYVQRARSERRPARSIWSPRCTSDGVSMMRHSPRTSIGGARQVQPSAGIDQLGPTLVNNVALANTPLGTQFTQQGNVQFLGTTAQPGWKRPPT